MPGIERLLTLQEVDTTIDRLRARTHVLEAGGELAAVRAEADAAESRLGELRLKLDELSRDQMKLEHEVDSLSQKQAAEEARMYDGSVVNARELESLQHEIDNLKRRRVDREDELLALMEQREQHEASAAESETLFAAARERVEEVGGAAAEELERIDKELDTRIAERASMLPDIDPEALELYEDLRPQKRGVAAVALVDGVCQGCHEQLSAVELDRVKKTRGLARCDHCRRILVL